MIRALVLTLTLLISGNAWLFENCTIDAECESIDELWPWNAKGKLKP